MSVNTTTQTRNDGLELMLVNVQLANEDLTMPNAIRAGLSIAMVIAVSLHAIADALERDETQSRGDSS